MGHDHPFSQRNKTTERRVEMGFGGDREGGRVGQTPLHKIGGLGPLCQLCSVSSPLLLLSVFGMAILGAVLLTYINTSTCLIHSCYFPFFYLDFL